MCFRLIDNNGSDSDESFSPIASAKMRSFHRRDENGESRYRSRRSRAPKDYNIGATRRTWLPAIRRIRVRRICIRPPLNAISRALKPNPIRDFGPGSARSSWRALSRASHFPVHLVYDESPRFHRGYARLSRIYIIFFFRGLNGTSHRALYNALLHSWIPHPPVCFLLEISLLRAWKGRDVFQETLLETCRVNNVEVYKRRTGKEFSILDKIPFILLPLRYIYIFFSFFFYLVSSARACARASHLKLEYTERTVLNRLNRYVYSDVYSVSGARENDATWWFYGPAKVTPGGEGSPGTVCVRHTFPPPSPPRSVVRAYVEPGLSNRWALFITYERTTSFLHRFDNCWTSVRAYFFSWETIVRNEVAEKENVTRSGVWLCPTPLSQLLLWSTRNDIFEIAYA